LRARIDLAGASASFGTTPSARKEPNTNEEELSILLVSNNVVECRRRFWVRIPRDATGLPNSVVMPMSFNSRSNILLNSRCKMRHFNTHSLGNTHVRTRLPWDYTLLWVGVFHWTCLGRWVSSKTRIVSYPPLAWRVSRLFERTGPHHETFHIYEREC